VIDRLREQIQQRLDQLANEAERLRKALAALDPRPSTTTDSKPAEQPPVQESKPSTRRAAAERKSTPAADAPARTAPGATKAAVLAALAGGEAMTAGEVAAKSGLARGTVSTTLSKLAKTGEVHKADRGYQLAPELPDEAPPA
jgi:DNA-binding transcriptional ArsR family regulator